MQIREVELNTAEEVRIEVIPQRSIMDMRQKQILDE
jgi:hypothetical protein